MECLRRECVDWVDKHAEQSGVDLVDNDGKRFEMRLIIYSTAGVTESDLYFRAKFGSQEQKTDCHMRMSDG